ncbi:MAG: acetyl-CoA carboxylase biotin carboxyl carrier protein [Bacteroidetes bacterium SB0662_bin_6]|nr:acetyl-CoA carboxylase biotin carboxyl carrier protein [Bacteroidetes bacterium SB0668_bin_1]MYE03619.1 acetyl-CoA carboxylase biotin carboxyl carrier protein [Bacteroidetes bacterium SB0662_bin_6]
MDLSLIRKLLKIVRDSGVAEVEITEDDFKVVVRTQPPAAPAPSAPPPVYSAYAAPPPAAYAPPPAPAPAPSAPPAQPAPVAPAPEPPPSQEAVAENQLAASRNGTVVKAPIVGTFYRAPAPGEAPFVEVGDIVRAGDTLCIIEAMKLMNEIESEVDGKVAEILVDDALPVEYDHPLFLIET